MDFCFPLSPIARDNGMRRGTTKRNLFHNYEVNYIEKPSELLAHSVNERSNYEETCLLKHNEWIPPHFYTLISPVFCNEEEDLVIVILGFLIADTPGGFPL
ncbi:hypothetical protein CEXT_107301 [Caerostris extrusa]|uniref:Uncharacterized protein n=1 Tax=Caerostris extrusa TaxID=172846 RepID=A0AAV4T8H0_CAEEX|nr:hypothetical protein CEXT_107301 [Caerostris extrusa]